MNRKTLLAGVFFAGLLLVAALVMKSPEKGTRTAEEVPRPVKKLTSADFDTLVVEKDGKGTTVMRDGASWKVTAPVAYAADKDAAKDAFEAVEQLEWGSIITDQTSKHAELEVSDKATHVTVKKGAAVVADLRIGKVANNQTMIRLEGKNEVWQSPGSLSYRFDKGAGGFRDKSITTFEETAVTRIEVAAKDGSRVALEKPAAGNPDAGAPPAGDSDWLVKQTSIKIEKLDKSVPQGIVNALYALKTNDFADDAKPEETGLAAPALTVTVTLKDGTKQAVLVGNKKGDDDYFVKKDGADQVFLVKKYGIDRVAKRPIEFREKTLCNLAEGEIRAITVTRKADGYSLQRTGDASDAWKFAQPKAELDTSKVASIAGAFTEWKATGFAEDTAPATTGLASPAATITATSKLKGNPCALKVGAATKDDQSYHVQVAGRPDVFLVAKWTMDRVLVKLDDLKKK